MIMKAFADPEQFLRNRATHVDNPIVHLFFSEGTGFEAFLELVHCSVVIVVLPKQKLILTWQIC